VLQLRGIKNTEDNIMKKILSNVALVAGIALFAFSSPADAKKVDGVTFMTHRVTHFDDGSMAVKAMEMHHIDKEEGKKAKDRADKVETLFSLSSLGKKAKKAGKKALNVAKDAGKVIIDKAPAVIEFSVNHAEDAAKLAAHGMDAYGAYKTGGTSGLAEHTKSKATKAIKDKAGVK
jgi:hypothetical protein